MAFFINVVRIAAAISVKIDGSFLNSTILKMLGLPFPYKLNGVSYITFVSKTVSSKIGALTIRFLIFFSWSFFLSL